MQISLNWQPSVTASLIHAVAALAAGRSLLHAAADAAWRKRATRLAQQLADLPIGSHAAWQRLRTQAAHESRAAQLAAGTVGPESFPGREERVQGIEYELESILACGAELFPRLEAELELRSRPLREQWEACGPGLFREACRRLQITAPSLRATVLPVYPVLGGGGGLQGDGSGVWIEAVLTNPYPQLPEFVRLAWLLMRLVTHDQYAPAEVIPSVLMAAEEVEAACCDPLTLKLAHQAWLDPPPQ